MFSSVIDTAGPPPDTELHAAPIAVPGSLRQCLLRRSPATPAIPRAEKRQHEFAVGRYCASNALEQIGIEGCIGAAADRSPIWPSGAVGSISHSEQFGWALVGAVDAFLAVGIDTEPIADEATIRQLRDEIGTDRDWQLGRQVGLDERTLFTTVFSAKESFYKCVYPLQTEFFGFHDVRLVAMDTQSVSLRMQPHSPNPLFKDEAITIRYEIAYDSVFTACWLPMTPTSSRQDKRS